MKMAGIVICGGQSRRMGTAKEWLDFGGESLLARMVRLVGSRTSCVIVASSLERELPPLASSVLRVNDQTPDCGPIEGLYRGLLAARDRAYTHAFVASVDVPLLEPKLIARMQILVQPEDDAVVPYHQERRQPLVALYQVGIIDKVAAAIAAQQYALQGLLDHLRLREMTPAEYADIDPQGLSFFNINTSEDYRLAIQLDRGRQELP